jgi:hypothetical protein
MKEIRKDNRETPWQRQERMLLQRRFDVAQEKALEGSPGELMWIVATGQLPSNPDEDRKLYSKGMLDKLGEPDTVVDICKCVAWVCAIGYIFIVGVLIAIWSMRFTPNQNTKWLGMGWCTVLATWIVVAPMTAMVGGLIAALKQDTKALLIWFGEKWEYYGTVLGTLFDKGLDGLHADLVNREQDEEE